MTKAHEYAIDHLFMPIPHTAVPLTIFRLLQRQVGGADRYAVDAMGADRCAEEME